MGKCLCLLRACAVHMFIIKAGDEVSSAANLKDKCRDIIATLKSSINVNNLDSLLVAVQQQQMLRAQVHIFFKF